MKIFGFIFDSLNYGLNLLLKKSTIFIYFLKLIKFFHYKDDYQKFQRVPAHGVIK